MVRTKKVRIANPKKNPLLVGLGANPREVNMTKKKNGSGVKKNTHSASVSAKRNSALPMKKKKNGVYVMAKKKNGRGKSGNRNPVLFGRSITPIQLVKLLVAALAGVTVTKFVPTMLPDKVTENDAAKVAVSGGVAMLFGLAVAQMEQELGAAAAFGGGMHTFSVALNTWLPSVGRQIGISGVRGVGAIYNTDQPNAALQSPFAPRRLPAGPSPMAILQSTAGVSGVYRKPY